METPPAHHWSCCLSPVGQLMIQTQLMHQLGSLEPATQPLGDAPFLHLYHGVVMGPAMVLQGVNVLLCSVLSEG